MTRSLAGILLTLLPLMGIACTGTIPTVPASAPEPAPLANHTIKLPEPRTKGEISLEETLLNRRSIRDFADKPLTLYEVSQLLWSAQGMTGGGRTAPSAGALYPLEVYLVAGNVDNLAPGVYKYKPGTHELTMFKAKDMRRELAEAALNQEHVSDGAINIIITAIYERTTGKYGDRGIRYVHMEAGHASQNIYLQATALGLGTVTIGAFHDEQVKTVLGMPQNEAPLYIMPVGRK